jgi:hypothetical protein
MEKFCPGCNQTKNGSEFYKERDRKDGLTYYCKECNKARIKIARYEDPKKAHAIASKWRLNNLEKKRESNKDWERKNPNKVLEFIRKTHLLHPDRYRARNAVNNAVRDGKLQPASNFICSNCKKIQASEYHHHNGYDPDHWLDVIPLCKACHKD